MQSKLIKILLIVFIANIGLLNLNFTVYAQTTEDEKPARIKDFGASLKPGFEKKKTVQTQKDGNNVDEIIRVKTELVVNDIIVMDKQGNFVNGLVKDDFIVKEDDALQTIEEFSRGSGGKVPRSIVLIIDCSGSLTPYLKTSIEAAKILIDKLNPNDRMAIVTDSVELLTNFTRNKKLLKNKLDSMQTGKWTERKCGMSRQYSALYATLNELFDNGEIARPIIIFQTDGDQLGRLKGNILPPIPPTVNLPLPFKIILEPINFSFDDIVTAVETNRATIYTIIPGFRFFGISESEQINLSKKDIENHNRFLNDKFLSRVNKPQAPDNDFLLAHAKFISSLQLPMAELARFSGGWTDYIETPEKAADVYSRVLADINSRYIVGYYPTNQTHDGKRRKVSIEVRGHPEYIVWGRKSYFAPEENN